MFHLVAALLAVASPAVAQQASPQPAASAPVQGSPAPITTATPSLGALPQSTKGLVIPVVPNVAPNYQAPATELPSGDIAGNRPEFVGLSIDNAIAMALARNTDLSVAQSNRAIASFQIVAAQGAYDLQLQIQPSFSYQNNASTNAFFAGPGGGANQVVTSKINGSVNGRLSSGGTINAGTSASHIDDNNVVNSFEPYFETSAYVNISQPLLRGRATDDTRRQIQLSRINATLSSDNALLTASDTISSTLDAYFDLVAAWRNVGIQEDGLLQAKAQSESNQRLVRRGQLAPADVVESNTQVSVFQDNVYAAIQNVASLQNQLKRLILSDPADPIWMANLVPTTTIDTVAPEPAVNEIVLRALKSRPEVAQLRDNLQSAGVNLAYYKDQTLPQLDLSLGVTENGFAGRLAPFNANPLDTTFGNLIGSVNALIARANAVPGSTPLTPIPGFASAIPPYNVGGLGQAYNNMFAGRYPQYSVSATLGFPLRNRTAEANYRAGLEQVRQIAIQEVALVQRIEYEARNAVQAYRAARSRLIAAKAARVSAELVAASELRKFRAGVSTTFLVLQREQNLATQRGRELQAQTDLAKAQVQLDVASGDILANNKVDVSTLGKTPTDATPLSK